MGLLHDIASFFLKKKKMLLGFRVNPYQQENAFIFFVNDEGSRTEFSS